LIAGGLVMVVSGCSSAPHAVDLRCENRISPLGIDEAQPRLSWQIESGKRGTTQSAYRVLVATDPKVLADSRGDVWDSGKVPSDQSINVEYGGPELTSGQTCYWKVRVWDNHGSEGESDVATWEMGCLQPGDWAAKWIDFPDSTEKDKLAATRLTTRPANPHRKIFPPNHPPYLRKAFAINKPVKRARLYITALGLYRVWINGEAASDAVFAPDWTDYHHRVRYQTFDVTGVLRQGTNAIGALLGDGWYSGNVGWIGAHVYGSRPALLGQLVIDYADGTRDVVGTDSSWRAAVGPFIRSDFQDGEDYDATLEIAGWNAAAFDDSSWSHASVRDESVQLEAQVGPPIRRSHELATVRLTEPKPGRYVFDFGQNLVGFTRLKAAEPRGTKISIAFAEMLNPDGTIYTENLREARAIDSYIFRGGGEENWEPSFTFHGFRYAEISGLGGKPDPKMLTAIAIGSDNTQTGAWESDNAMLNKLYSNIVWGQRGNFISVPTDCPQRDERLGWMGDAQVFIRTAAYNCDVRNFFENWLVEVADAQQDDGAFTDVSPHVAAGSGVAAWADAGVICPWVTYQMYGDKRVLERQYPSMVKFIDYLQKHSDHLIRPDKGYGDWLNIKAETRKDLIGTAYFAHSTDLVARTAEVIGKREDALKYRRLSSDIIDAFNKKFVSKDEQVEGNTQTGYLLYLNYMLPENADPSAARDHLLADIAAKKDHLSTGFVGVGLLLPTLTEIGATDVAYRLLLQDTFPSWLFPVKNGATTIWERWDGWTPEHGFQTPTMNSFNHYSLGSCGQWMFATAAGIAPAQPGFKRITICPIPGGGLKTVTASYKSPYGLIKTKWELDGKQFKLWVTVPANTEADVELPGMGASVVDGADSARRDEKNSSHFIIGSGDYVFTSTM
jgi:alpha-L-rhamnosidase